jgi:phage baseplate assembly protein W
MTDAYKQIIEILIDTPTGDAWIQAPNSPEFRDGTAKRYALENYRDRCRLNSITNALDSDTLRIVMVADQ